MTAQRTKFLPHLDAPGGTAATCRRTRDKRSGLAVGLALLAFPGVHGVPANADTAGELQQLRDRIQVLQQQLDETLGKRDAEQAALRELERKIGGLHRSVQRLDAEIENETEKLQKLRRQKRQAQASLRTQSTQLEKQVRAAYATGKQEYLKMLLNQKDPGDMSRVLVYYRYLNRARVAQIREIEDGLTALQQLAQQIDTRTRTLESVRADQAAKKTALNATRTERSKILAALERQVHTQSQEINRLRQDEQRLEALLNNLRDYLKDMEQVPQLETRFSDVKGSLKLPATGRITARYGSPKNVGDLRWKGIFLAGAEGREIASVFRGRVAYADWLHGFGLLLILEHGDGYMTLYGHNQSLYKEVGDWVETGQVIASSGATGNPLQPGVYFEIRHNGEPHDPLRWCKPL